MSTLGKIGLSSLLVVAIVGAALWILGGKQAEYSTALSIDAPPEAIFPFLTQPEHLKNWTTGLNEVSEFLPTPKVDGIASGPIQKTARVVTTPDGSQVRYEDRVIRFEKNQSISVQSSNAQQVLTYIYQLEPRDGQTFLSYRLKTSNSGTGRFLAPLSKSDFQDRLDNDIRKLKTLVESSPLPIITSPSAEAAEQLTVDSNTPLDVSKASLGQPEPGISQRYKTGFPEKPSNSQATAVPTLGNTPAPASNGTSAVPGSGNSSQSPVPGSGNSSQSPDLPNQPNAETPVTGQPFSF